MATVDLGKIKQVFRGTYDNSTAYAVDDLVVFTDGSVTSTYICTTASTGNNPSSGGTAHANWAYLAKGVADPIPSQSGQSGKFLTTNGSALSFGDVSAGITMADQWRVHSNFNSSSSSHLVNSNWERNDTHFAQIGTGMSESSGVFTFPQTGIYLIKLFGTSYGASGDTNIMTLRIQTRKSGGDYADSAQVSEAAHTTNAYGSMATDLVFDVEDTSGDNIRITAYSAASGRKILGSSTAQRTGITFIRLGDT